MVQHYITSFVKFLSGAILLSVFFMLMLWLVPQYAPSPVLFAGISFFFFIISWLSYLFMANAAKKENNSFVRSFIGTTALKLFLYIIVLLSLVFVLENLEVAVILSFLAAFMVYTTIETYYLYKFLKK